MTLDLFDGVQRHPHYVRKRGPAQLQGHVERFLVGDEAEDPGDKADHLGAVAG